MNRDLLYPLRRLHGQLYDAIVRHNLRKTYHKLFFKQPNTVFLVMTPDHGNLGDHAITQAVTVMLKDAGINIIEITTSQLKEMKFANQLSALDGFPILINGGGNLGTLWMWIENLERDILKQNPHSHILVLPNTIYYGNNTSDQEELKNSIQIYNNHKHLTLYAREQVSYDFMKPIYRDVRLVPDMVLSLKKDHYSINRKGCLLCLRNDCEKTRTQQQDRSIRHYAAELFADQVTITDMDIGSSISAAQRESVLNAKYEEFAGAELVITDRLHAMIFCAITGTPCIVIDSKSPKLRGCYEWVKHLSYIRFANSPEDIPKQYNTIPNAPHYYNNSHLTHYYQSLVKDIKSLWR